MKIAIIHPDFNIKGGAENVILWLCEDLVKKPGWEITVFSGDFSGCESRLQNIAGLKIKKIYVPGIFKNSQIGRLFFATFFLKKNLKNFDVVNPHNYPASLWVGVANILSGKKLPKIVWSCNEPTRFLYRKICNAHTPENLQVLHFELNEDLTIKMSSRVKFFLKNTYKPVLRYIDKKAVRTFRRILTLSDFVGEQVKKIYGAENVFTCYAGIKIIKENNFVPKKDTNRFFLTVSRLDGCKNIQNVIGVFNSLKKEDTLKEVKYYIVGQGPFENYLKNLIKKYNLENQVKMLGYISREELLSHYSNCTAVIYIPYDEPFGLPYLEAAVFSKPAIASNHGGPSEIVVHNKTGLLVNPSDLDDITQAVKKIFQNNSETEKMGQRAFYQLKEIFLRDKYIERFITSINAEFG
ncbi:MAG: glycosyltransferase [Elusimicrobiota bacterium]|nr:glycosyltransferase [Elusimicrobiota bacterium]